VSIDGPLDPSTRPLFNTLGLNFTLISNFTYDLASEHHVQTFAVTPPIASYRIITFEILSNWGNKEMTCVYRIRVHGDPKLT
jgi:SUN domain-containing protein 1/2